MTVARMHDQQPVRTADASVDPPTVTLPVQAHPAGPAPVPAPGRPSDAAAGRPAQVVALAVVVAVVLVAGMTTAVLFGTGLGAQLWPAGAAGAPAAGAVPEPAMFAVTGTVELTDARFAAAGLACAGAHADVREGAPVLVADATGTVVATGTLGPGRPSGPAACTFPFTVPGVPTGTAFYLVEVGRYTVTYSGADLRTYGAALRIGE